MRIGGEARRRRPRSARHRQRRKAADRVERAGATPSRWPIGAAPSRSITPRCARSPARDRRRGGGAVSRAREDAVPRASREPDRTEAPRRVGRARAGIHYDPAWRVHGAIDTGGARSTFEISLAADGVLRCTRVGRAHFSFAGRAASARDVLARGLRRRAVAAVLPTRTSGARDLRRRTLPLRHDQGRRPGRCRRATSCSTSITRTTRRARTTSAGRARCRRRRTGCRSR